jgi:peptide-methionine (S)-S-oxide reductase
MKKSNFFLLLLLSSSVLQACTMNPPTPANNVVPTPTPIPSSLQHLETAYFASGCFWCVEAIYESLKGVEEVVSGYAGGKTANPTYKQVISGRTGHAETIQVFYNPKIISFKTLLKVFFDSHDPTTLNRQGPDRGTQYRSIAFYETAKEKGIIEAYIQLLTNKKVFKDKITTEVKKLSRFYKAEKYHQDYERLNPNSTYIQRVSKPRLLKFQINNSALLKENDNTH